MLLRYLYVSKGEFQYMFKFCLLCRGKFFCHFLLNFCYNSIFHYIFLPFGYFGLRHEQEGRLNHNLEQTARAIFEEYFGGREPNGVLADIANITMGQSPSGESFNEDGHGTIFYQGRAEFGTRFPTHRLFTTSPNRMAECGDVLLSVRAPVGDLNVANERCCIGRGLAAIRGKHDNQSFLLYTMIAAREQLDIFNGTGTVFGSINKNALEKLAVYVPNSHEIKNFEIAVCPIDKQIAVTSADSTQLANLRDTLLPRLMSGELSVNG